MSRIKILFTIPNFDTAGSGQVLLNIAKNLNRDEFEPHICCNHDKGAYFKVVEATGIPIHIARFTADLSPKLRIIPSVIKISKFFKLIFTCPAYWAYPVFWKFIKGGSWSYSGARISLFRVINIATYTASVFAHAFLLF